ncbi:hypothetical protein SEPCBS57363_006508 [Sporothrix epigloea]|uniref:J domain-containing protein n=1 Tax=Sporothrix epigloea TaxID=1892477 RepID=A0ABP0E3D8_9PEZI
MDDKAELAAFARESAKSGLDLYELLGVDGTTSREDIHRAWRRKGLKYHPDKAGADYDPALYERFSRARDILVDDEARTIYDMGRAAAAQRRLQSEQMSAERRRFKDELEAAEREHSATSAAAGNMGGAPFAPAAPAAAAGSERDKLREAGRRRAEERQRREKEVQDKVRQREDERIAEIEQRLREKEAKARQRAERKAAGRSGTGAEADIVNAKPESNAPGRNPPVSQPDSAWRQLLKSGTAQVKEGNATTIQQHPLYAFTMNRLKKAGEAQLQRGANVSHFDMQWDEVEDPEVKKFITRVPRFVQPKRSKDATMDTAA